MTPATRAKLLAVACTLIGAGVSSEHSLASQYADTVLRGGAVYTVNASRSWAEALAIREDKIVFVGSDEEVNAFTGPDTRVIELDGKMVLPGFHDSHIHPISAMLKSKMCNLTGLAGREAYLERVRQCVAESPGTQWLMGAGWSHSYFDDQQRPD